MTETSLSSIRDFLSLRRIALVGLSRSPRNFSRILMRELLGRGYDVVPVNPAAAEIEGRRCYPEVNGIEPPVEGALIMTSKETSQRVVQECWRAGVRRVWIFGLTGPGSHQEAAAFCRDHGVSLVAGECPFMFLPNAGLLHSLHGWTRKLTGAYPA